MKLKTYFGKSLKDAMDQAKAELGDNVVILESKKVTKDDVLSFGKGMVEITAALDITEGIRNGYGNIKKVVIPGSDNKKQFLDYLTGMPTPVATFQKADEMANEIEYLRQELKKLHNQLRKVRLYNFPSAFEKVYNLLLEKGICSDHAAAFVRRAYLALENEKITQAKILARVRDEIKALFNRNDLLNGKIAARREIVVLFGPTGAGKTTTIMKMAMNNQIYGTKKVAIMSTDTYRVAGSEPLRAFSRIASIPFVEVRSPDDVAERIEKMDDIDVILVDMPGRSPLFPNYIREHCDYLAAFNPTDVFMVLSLTADLDDLYFSTGLYLTLNPSGIVFTKLDETSLVGKLVSMTKEIQLPVVYVSDGQAIPGDIWKARGEIVWEKMMVVK